MTTLGELRQRRQRLLNALVIIAEEIEHIDVNIAGYKKIMAKKKAADVLIDDMEELRTMTPEEIERYTGKAGGVGHNSKAGDE